MVPQTLRPKMATPSSNASPPFMVHAVRIPDPPADSEQVVAGDGLTAGFPWWALWFVGGSAVVAVILFAPPRKKRR